MTPKEFPENSIQKECLKPVVIVVVLLALCRALRRPKTVSGNLLPSKITPQGGRENASANGGGLPKYCPRLLGERRAVPVRLWGCGTS